MDDLANEKLRNPIIGYEEAILRENKGKGDLDEDLGPCEDNLE